MKRKPPTTPAASRCATSVSGSFKEAPEEYPKRLTLDLRKSSTASSVYAIFNVTSMNRLLRDYNDQL